MDYTGILKRAWHLVKSYRALWVFGVILALTTFSWETAVFWGRDDHDDANHQGIVVTREPGETLFEAFQRTIREEIDEANQGIEEFFAQELHVEIESDILAIITVLAAMMLIGYVIAKIFSYVGAAALIRMVDAVEDGEVQHNVRQGFRMGWSRAAWRFFLIDLLIDTTAVSTLILLFALTFTPLALWTTGSTPAGVIGTLLTLVLFFPGLALIIVAGAALSMLKRFFRRVCALEGLGVTDSIRRGYAIARQHLREVAPLWLITVGLELTWPFLTIPVVIVLAGAGLLVGGGSALLMGRLAGLAFDGATPWVVAGAVGIPIFILTLVAPLAFLGGLREVFLSSTWTLTYRELRAIENTESGRLPRVDSPDLEAASAT